jgi:thiamine biosynthesis lipoprotein
VATSSIRKRRWSTEFGPQHHVLDPATGRPSTSDLMSFTVIATETWWAEALSTAGVVGGRDVALELLGESGSTGMWMTTAGEVGHAPGIER